MLAVLSAVLSAVRVITARYQPCHQPLSAVLSAAVISRTGDISLVISRTGDINIVISRTGAPKRKKEGEGRGRGKRQREEGGRKEGKGFFDIHRTCTLTENVLGDHVHAARDRKA